MPTRTRSARRGRVATLLLPGLLGSVRPPATGNALTGNVAVGHLPTGTDGASVHACTPGSCALALPTAIELAAFRAEAERLVARYAADTSTLGHACAALGATMRAHAGDVRMIAFMWRATDADGNTGPVTGDAHTVETVPGTGIVHIARGFDPLNPDRGLPDILRTARHEFAHLTGARQREGGFDEAEYLARACGPAPSPRVATR